MIILTLHLFCPTVFLDRYSNEVTKQSNSLLVRPGKVDSLFTVIFIILLWGIGLNLKSLLLYAQLYDPYEKSI